VERKYRLVIAEDCTILRQGLCSLLSADSECEVVGQAGDGLVAIREVQKSTPDLVLLDLSMPRLNGLSAMKEIKRLSPGTRILALTVHESEEYVLEAFRSGADGYCLKDSSREELASAIKVVLSGKPYFSPGISDKVIEGYIEGRKKLKSKTSWETLTERERQVLKLVGEGYASKEIADYLCISVKTVEKHRANIMEKCGLHNVSNLTAYAIEQGLVTRKKDG
jgi:DNA-binding NarL/FixJ family response regulator